VKKRQLGVTLLELLIAVTLLSLLSVAMFTAMRLGLSAFTKTDDKLMANRRAAGAQRILQSEIEGLIPTKVACGGDNPLAPAGAGENMPFFGGEPEALHLVSGFSVQQGWRGQPQILEMFVIPGEDRGVRLVVNELPYTGPYSTGRMCRARPADAMPQFRPPQAGPLSFVLADKLAYCRFAYLMADPDPTKAPVWKPVWTEQTFPLAVRVEMAPLDPDPSQVQPITITAPIHLIRRPDRVYVDR
jgi:prepilin-type N-terminal cleavage/methylation domain-containing protein